MRIKEFLIACIAVAFFGCTSQPPTDSTSEHSLPKPAADAEPPPTASPPPPPPPPAPPPLDRPPAAPGPRPPPRDGPGGGGTVGARPAADSAAYAIVRPYFATNRKRLGNDLLKASFGGERGVLTYGTCEVSIPRYHRVGQLESPSIWRLEFREDPAKHVVLMSVSTKPKAEYFAQLARSIAAARDRTAFVFVHGYNVSFEDAARRTAQMSYDIGYKGVPVFFSWPSQSSLSAYTVDEQNIEWAEVGLQSFLHDFLAQSGVSEVVLIAHSMGNRGLTRTLAAVLNDNPNLRSKVKEIILAAPDIDADVFRDKIAPALIQSQRPITLYASSKDLALSASREVHGAARAGDSGPGLIIVPGIETIDATDVDTSLLGHSYIGDSPSVITDMTRLIRDGLRAEKRAGLSVVERSGGRYWAVTR